MTSTLILGVTLIDLHLFSEFARISLLSDSVVGVGVADAQTVALAVLEVGDCWEVHVDLDGLVLAIGEDCHAAGLVVEEGYDQGVNVEDCQTNGK